MSYRAWGPAPALVAALAVVGCSYQSDYRPPNDGRARAIWQDDKAIVAAPAELPECVSRKQPPEGYAYTAPQDGGYYYAPSGHTHVYVGVIIIGRPPLVPIPIVPGGIAGNLSGEGGKYVAVALAVGAIVAFPFLALGLAMGHPEPEEEVAGAIDTVNTYNDQSRERMERCAAWYEQLRQEEQEGGAP